MDGTDNPELPGDLPEPIAQPGAPVPLALSALREMDIHQLTAAALEAGIEGAAGLKKHELIFRILQEKAERNGVMFGEGVLEILPDGFGFLRAPDSNYLACPDDIYVSPSQIRRFDLQDRRTVMRARSARRKEGAVLRAAQGRGDQLRAPEQGDGQDAVRQPDAALSATSGFSARDHAGRHDHARASTCSRRIGKGQRGLIVAPPRTGKTILLQKIANAIADEPPRGVPDRAADRRAAGGSHRHGAHRSKARGDQLHLRRAGRRATSRWPRW